MRAFAIPLSSIWRGGMASRSSLPMHEYPAITDLSADFTYARLQRTREEEPTGYSEAELDHWASVARGSARAAATSISS